MRIRDRVCAVYPCILVYFQTFVIAFYGRYQVLQVIYTFFRCKQFLVVTRFYIPFIREYPELQQVYFFIAVVIVFAMEYACACAHYLYLVGVDGLCVPHTVFMLQRAIQYHGYDFHIIVRMFAKAHTF